MPPRRLPLMLLFAGLLLMLVTQLGEVGAQGAPTPDPRAKLDARLRQALALHELIAGLDESQARALKSASESRAMDTPVLRLARQLSGTGTEGPRHLALLVHTTDDAQSLAAADVQVRARVGDVATAYLPPDRLLEIAALPAVVSIRADDELSPTVDVSVPATGASEVWGTYHSRGQGILIGLIDSGFDFRHPDFIKPDGTTRIKGLLDLSDPGDPESDGVLNGPVYGGTLYTEDQINAALTNLGLYYRSADELRPIPDNSSLGLTSTLSVAEAMTITSAVLDLYIYHSNVGDLVVKLQCPSGTMVTLQDRSGGSRDDLIGAFPITACVGQSGQGQWRLTVSDNARPYTGSLDFWALHLNQPVRMGDQVGHGTHVAGIAASNGRGTGNGQPANTYVGMAPDADIIAVRGTRDFVGGMYTSDIVNALAFIDGQATSLGRPYVVNMSLGSQAGPHDGTELHERAIDNLVGAGKPGKAVVVSAGNDGARGIHTSGRVTLAQSATLSINVPASSIFDADIWYKGSDTFSLRFVTPTGTVMTADAPPGGSRCYNDSAFNWVICLTHAANSAYNGDKEVWVTALSFKAGRWDIILNGQAVSNGHYDAWLVGSFPANLGWTAPDNQMRVGSPGNARSAITVASYTTRADWTDSSGTQHTTLRTPGFLAASSSDGPTRDGRQKPDLAAPGDIICATLSGSAKLGAYDSVFAQSDTCRDGRHGAISGTSMAAPHVTGAVALLLALNPHLDAAQIKNYLIRGTTTDSNTGVVPNTHWGYGKLNVAQAARDMLADIETPTPTVTATATATATATPTATATATRTATPSATHTSTATATATPTSTSTPTSTPTATLSATPTVTLPPGVTATATKTGTLTTTPTVTATATATATATFTSTATATRTATPTATLTFTPTATRTVTPGPSPTNTPAAWLYFPFVSRVAPGAPGPLSLSATSLSRDTVRLNWSASAGAVGYYVWQMNAVGGPRVVSSAGAGGSQYTLTLPPGAHTFQVQAFNAWGATASNNVTVTVVPPSPTPTATPVADGATIVASEDASIIAALPSTNAGQYVDMMTGYDHCTFGSATRSLIKFDVSAIRRDRPVTRVELGLHLDSSCDLGNRAHAVRIYRATGNWSEMGVTWSNQPGMGEERASTTVYSREWGEYTWDVTGLVRGWVDGSLPNQGIFVKANESSGNDSASLGFLSHEIDDPSVRPVLRITYAAGAKSDTPTEWTPSPREAQPLENLDGLPWPVETAPTEGGYRVVGRELMTEDTPVGRLMRR